MLDEELYIPTYQDMLDAHERIKPHINRTPIRTSAYLNELTGAQMFFKCECPSSYIMGHYSGLSIGGSGSFV